jgi:hypothetical protein
MISSLDRDGMAYVGKLADRIDEIWGGMSSSGFVGQARLLSFLQKIAPEDKNLKSPSFFFQELNREKYHAGNINWSLNMRSALQLEYRSEYLDWLYNQCEKIVWPDHLLCNQCKTIFLDPSYIVYLAGPFLEIKDRHRDRFLEYIDNFRYELDKEIEQNSWHQNVFGEYRSNKPLANQINDSLLRLGFLTINGSKKPSFLEFALHSEVNDAVINIAIPRKSLTANASVWPNIIFQGNKEKPESRTDLDLFIFYPAAKDYARLSHDKRSIHYFISMLGCLLTKILNRNSL